ncbi:MAG TPA: prepilin-type N-terminal cleavage/methylation domain-containing protein [Mycobacteriales bacterium]|nr:prepilin-type N-terminal cleavage/methylation domain-containing protein [Mycobacteriales bacterium]
MNWITRRLESQDRDAGFTLVEMLVSMLIFGLLSTAILTFTFSSARTVTSSNNYNDINEEARVVLNRMTRELREAKTIVSATNPYTVYAGANPWAFQPNADSSVTFDTDFNGNGTIEPDAPDPEEITYYYDRADRQLLLKAAGQSVPVLAANVEGFSLAFNSRIYRLGVYNLDSDLSASPSADADPGIVDWEELDADPLGVYGNGNHTLDQELQYIDSVTITLTMLKGSHQQKYTASVDLRNRPY